MVYASTHTVHPNIHTLSYFIHPPQLSTHWKRYCLCNVHTFRTAQLSTATFHINLETRMIQHNNFNPVINIRDMMTPLGMLRIHIYKVCIIAQTKYIEIYRPCTWYTTSGRYVFNADPHPRQSSFFVFHCIHTMGYVLPISIEHRYDFNTTVLSYIIIVNLHAYNCIQEPALYVAKQKHKNTNQTIEALYSCNTPKKYVISVLALIASRFNLCSIWNMHSKV